MKILPYFSKVSQVLPTISKVIAARRRQMGSGPLAGAAHHAHSSDDAFSSHHSTVFQGLVDLHTFTACMVSHLLWRPDISPSVLSNCRGSLLPAHAGMGLEDPEPARASGQHPWSTQLPSCSESAVTLPAKKSFLVGRFSFPVPLLAIFAFPLLVTASSCLLGQLPACCISSSPLPTSTSLRDQQPSCSAPHTQLSRAGFLLADPSHHSRPVKPTGLHGGHLSLVPSWCFSASLRRYCIKREEVYVFFRGGYLRPPVA